MGAVVPVVPPDHLVAVEPPCIHGHRMYSTWPEGNLQLLLQRLSVQLRSSSLSVATYDIYDHIASPCTNTSAAINVYLSRKVVNVSEIKFKPFAGNIGKKLYKLHLYTGAIVLLNYARN